jgi:hypothetical protein
MYLNLGCQILSIICCQKSNHLISLISLNKNFKMKSSLRLSKDGANYSLIMLTQKRGRGKQTSLKLVSRNLFI